MLFRQTVWPAPATMSGLAWPGLAWPGLELSLVLFLTAVVLLSGENQSAIDPGLKNTCSPTELVKSCLPMYVSCRMQGRLWNIPHIPQPDLLSWMAVAVRQAL